jgi:hypothetical protein
MNQPAPLSRRRLLKQTFAFSAALTLGGRKRVVAAGEVSAADQHLMMIGDWGAVEKDMKPQSAVAEGMKRYVADTKIKPGAMLLLGDNFYGAFKGGTKCPRWKDQFENMYPASAFPGPAYAMLGNHDYDDEPKDKLAAELAYAKDHPGTRWTMPAKWYAFDYPKQSPLIKFIVLDSNYKNRVVSLTDEEKSAQNAWLKAELAKPRTAPWLIVMAHHPLYSNGVHGDHPHLIAEWDPLFRQHKADFYFCGHDHDMQHMEFENHPTSFVLSGGGGARIREIKEIKHGPFGEGVYGFSHLQVNKDTLTVRHLDANRKQLHAFRKTTAGKVEIVS